jgi:hypothetical protein
LTQRAAKTSRVQYASTFLTFASFDWKATAADLPTTNFESYNVAQGQTFAEGIMGVWNSDFSFGGAWDAGTKPTGNPPNITPQDGAGPINLIQSRLDGTQMNYPLARIRTVHSSGAVEGLVLFDVPDAKNQGVFNLP